MRMARDQLGIPKSAVGKFRIEDLTNQIARHLQKKGVDYILVDGRNLSATEKQQIEAAIKTLTTEGYRVLAIAETNLIGNNFPATQQEFEFTFKGIVAFYDPQRKIYKRY